METSFCAGIFGNSGSPPATVGAATDGGLNGMASRFSGVRAAHQPHTGLRGARCCIDSYAQVGSPEFKSS
jgi:hypothetical protein